MTHIKFCGLMTHEHVQHAADLGVSFVGFVALAPASHRDLDSEALAELIAKAPPELETVLVTPSTDRPALDELLETTAPDIVQLTGHWEPDDVQTIARQHAVRTWRAYRPMGDQRTDVQRLRELTHVADAIVLDAMDPSGYGGHGDPLNWDHARTLVQELAGYPVVLAGGLNPDNITQAIRWVQPWCVDVSSGIERDGAKDPDRMAAFAQEAQHPT